MGRELKRVPLDFDWPLNTIWAGYLCPISFPKCEPCGGNGMNPATTQIAEDFYDFDNKGTRWSDKITQDEVAALVKAGRLMDWTHTCNKVPGEGWKKKVPAYVPTADEVNAANAPGAPGLLGHDAINRWILVKARAKRLGVYGKCHYCKGKGHFSTPKLEKLQESWKSIEPPKGEGYQLWTTTNEGAPISPVFKTLDELCAWAAQNATTFGSNRASASEWKRMLHDGFVCHQEGNVIFM